MKKNILLGLLLFVCVNVYAAIDFDVSMQTAQFLKSVLVTPYVVGLDGNELMNCFRRVYNKNNLSCVKPEKEVKIPKIFHFIWLGSPLPEIAKHFIATWVAHHPQGWTFKIWTDETVKQITLDNQKYYDRTDNYGVKSDLLKWELVYKFGGVYVDIDFECLQPIDILHHTYDFYTGIQPLDTQYVQLGAALFGAVPGHPILKHCIETVKDDWEKQGAPARTGPIHFTKSFFAVADTGDTIDIAFPASFMYPLGCRETDLKYDEWAQVGAFAVHHWAKSWMPKRYRTEQFKTIENDHLVQSWNDVGKKIEG